MVAFLNCVPSTSTPDRNLNVVPPRSVVQPVSVLLVDDDPSLRQGLRTLLHFYNTSNYAPFTIVGEAATPEQAISLVRQQDPVLILLDMGLGGSNAGGLATLKHLREFYRGKVLILSGHQDDELIFQAMQAGAAGYLSKDTLAAQLHTAITTILADQIYLAPDVATRFFRVFQLHAGRSLTNHSSIRLSDRELEVLHHLVQGDPNAEIARSLYITVATVKAHLTSIFDKLGVKSRSQAIVTALRLGLV